MTMVTEKLRLRPYQIRSIAAVYRAWEQYRRVLYVLPTGGGKTVVAARIAQRSRMGRGDVLFLAHRLELIDQAVTRLVHDGIAPNTIGVIRADDARINPTATIQIASIDTLRNRTRPNADLVIIDEAHRAAANSYATILSWYPRARVLGLTATPVRFDGRPLRDAFDVIVQGATPSELIRGGFILRPKIWTKPGQVIDLTGVRRSNGDYDLHQLGQRVNTRELVGDIVQEWIKHAAGRPTVAFCVTKAHAERVTRAFRSASVPAETLLGETDTTARRGLLGPKGTLARGTIKVAATCMVVSEGWDLPAVKCAILARPTRSLTLYLQQAGRILRPHGTFTPLILDHSGNALVHGIPTADREWSLDARVERGSGTAPVKCCGACGAVVAAGCATCSECGGDFDRRREVDEASGDLVDLEQVIAVERERLLGVVRAMGRPDAFALKVLEAKYGRVA